MTICTRVKNRTDHHWFKMVKDQMLTWNWPIQFRKNLPDLRLFSALTKINNGLHLSCIEFKLAIEINSDTDHSQIPTISQS